MPAVSARHFLAPGSTTVVSNFGSAARCGVVRRTVGPPRLCALTLFVAVAIASIDPAAAGAQGQQAVVTPPVVAVGSDTGSGFESSADTTGFVEVIDTGESWRGYETVGELLRSSVGVQVRRSGGREDLTTVSIRGSTAAQVKVLLDGVSLSRASDDIVNLSDIPMDAVERIEIYRGFTPLRFASGGAASTINIITRARSASPLATSVSYGSFDSIKATLHAGSEVSSARLSAFVTYRSTAGDFKFVADDTPQNPDDPVDRRRRRNNDHESIDVLLRYALPLAGGSALTLTNDIYYKDEGAPGTGSEESPRSRFRSTRAILAASYDGPSGARVSADFTIEDDTLRDPKGEGPIENSLGLPFERADNLTLATTLGVGRAWTWKRRHLIETSAEAAAERFRGTFPGIQGGPQRTEERYRLALAIGDEVYVPKLHLTVAAQLRTDLLWNRFDVDNLPVPLGRVPDDAAASVDPRLGLRWEVDPRLTLQANAGTYFRPPNFSELFGSDGFSVANPGLDAEQGSSVDVGLRAVSPRIGLLETGTFEYVYFRNVVDDQIIFVGTGARLPKPFNIDKTEARGHELRLELRLGHDVSLSANYTLQDTRNKSAIRDFRNSDVPTLPEEEFFMRLGFGNSRWHLDYELEYRGDVFLAQGNFQRVDAYTTHGLALLLRPPRSGGIALKIEANNLADEQFEDRLGFPVPGRAFYVTLSYARGPLDVE